MPAAAQRSMALDVGDARIGIALSDPMGILAQPHSTIENTGAAALKRIMTIAEQEQVDTIVIGLPLELDGSVGDQARKVQALHARLLELLKRRPPLKGVKSLLWDERLTTVQAERVLEGSGLKNRARRAALDRVSAAIILDSYLCALARK